MQKSKIKNQSASWRTKIKTQLELGFSIIEFIIYTAILALVVLFLFQLLLGTIANQEKGKAREVVINNTVNALNIIDYEIRNAKRIYDSTSDFASVQGQLTLVSEQNLPSGETEAYVDIFVNSVGQVCLKREITGVLCITSQEINVTRLDFNKVEMTDLSEAGIQTIIEAEFITNDLANRAPFNMQSFARLRND